MTPISYPLGALRRPRNIKHHKWVSGVGYTRGISRQCNCGKGHSSPFSMCIVFPRHRFGSSRFNTVFLLIFRLFYQASSFELSQAVGPDHPYSPRLLPEPTLKALPVNPDLQLDKQTKDKLPDLFKSYERFSTKEWLAALLEDPDRYKHWKIRSLTWIKALASPFSHEFVQFVIEDETTGQRTRIPAGREETGDWVMSGWDWTSGKAPSHHYELPMPLLSLVFDDPQSRPSVQALAKVLAATTERQPYYKFRREMCWWYAEVVLEEMHAKYGGKVKEWEWSRYRYSFIARTSLIRRKVLTKHAEAFKTQLAENMEF